MKLGLKAIYWNKWENRNFTPEEPFEGNFEGNDEVANWALVWTPEGSEILQESYVNLVPTAQGGTHVNGLRTGLLEAMTRIL